MKTHALVLRLALAGALAASLSGCGMGGMARAAKNTAGGFDKAECLAREFKGEAPCPAPE